MSSYEDWLSMYSSTMDDIGLGKSKHLRKLDLLLCAFDQEVSVIKRYMKNTYESIKTTFPQDNQKENIPQVTALQSPLLSRFKEPDNIKKFPEITNNTTSLKPRSLRLKRSPIQQKAVKESPDMFNLSEDAGCLNQNILSISDCESIIKSPETCSPRIKKKRSLRLTKSRELGFYAAPVPTKTPQLKSVIDLDADDVIESTPEVASCSKSRSLIRGTAKKKLFDRAASNKCSQSMYTLTQMYKKQRSNHATSMKEATNPSGCDSDRTLTELNMGDNVSIAKGTQSSLLDIDDLLERLKCESHIADETEVCSIPIEAPKPKKICRECNMKGSPCRRHMEPIILKEPDDTFSGFWNLDFSIKQNKPKTNECDDLTQESAVFR